jgi:hypothetical protein
MNPPIDPEELARYAKDRIERYGSAEQYYLYVKRHHEWWRAMRLYIEKEHPWVKESTNGR